MKSSFNLFPLLFLVLLGMACSEPSPSAEARWQHKLPAPQLTRMSYQQYGIDSEELEIVQANFEQGQYLKDVLLSHEVEMAQIDEIAQKSESVFDVRMMRAGKTFTILKDRMTQEVAYFIYEMNDAEFVVFDLRDSVEVYMDQHETSSRQHEIAGVIQGSLYESFQAQGLEISLAKLLEEVFAWSVDFFHLEDGDGFKVIYEEQFVDGISIGISQILAAQIVHEDTIYDAFHFDGDSLGDYFDRNGMALRRQFLKSPVSYHTYGEAASASEFPSRQSRLSLDFGAPQHTPVLAMGQGTVSKIRRQRGHLNSVSVSHEGGFQTQYMHLSKIDPELQEGQELKQGDEIGYVGSPRGSSTHVRLRFWKNGRQVHPNQVEFPATLQLTEAQFSQFQRQVARYQVQLSRLQLDQSLLSSFGSAN